MKLADAVRTPSPATLQTAARDLVADLDLPVTLLTASLPAEARRRALAAIASGQAAIVVGTHALIQDAVTFGDLATTAGATPTWDRPSATCSSVYCHGATLPGGTNTRPTWTKYSPSSNRLQAARSLAEPETALATANSAVGLTKKMMITNRSGKVGKMMASM